MKILVVSVASKEDKGSMFWSSSSPNKGQQSKQALSMILHGPAIRMVFIVLNSLKNKTKQLCDEKACTLQILRYLLSDPLLKKNALWYL